MAIPGKKEKENKKLSTGFRLSQRTMETLEIIIETYPALNYTQAVERAIEDWRRNHTGENSEINRLEAIKQELIEQRMMLDQLLQRLPAQPTSEESRRD